MAMHTFTQATSARRQLVDITGEVKRATRESGLASGICVVSVPHCTCAVYVNENESGLVEDTLALVGRIVRGQEWRHDRIDDNASAHLGAMVVGNSVTLPVESGEPRLGTWQSVMLVELDGPRDRRVNVTVVGE